MIRECFNKDNIKLYTMIVYGIKNSVINTGARGLYDFAGGLDTGVTICLII